MAYFPSFRPFYDPDKEQEVYREHDGRVRVRSRPQSPSGVDVLGDCRPDPGNWVDGIHKIESSWSQHVRPEQGDLFYIDVDGKSRGRRNSLPHDQANLPSQPAQHDAVDALSRQNGMRHSDSAVPRPRLSRGSGSEEDEEEKMRSRAELRRKSEQLQQALRRKQNQPRNGEIPRGGKYRTSKKRREPVLIQQNNSKQLLNQNSTHCTDTDMMTSDVVTNTNGAIHPQKQQQNGRQLKDVTLLPDFSKRTDLSGSKVNGAELIELLLGIVLCRYNQRPPSGASQNGDTAGGPQRMEKKDRKLVVQGIVSGSAADKSGKIHRGDMLVCINGQEVTWSSLMSSLTSLIQSVKKEVKLTFQVPKIIGPTSCSTSPGVGSSRLPAYHNLCMLVTGRDIFFVQQQLLQHICVAMYLTLVSSSEESSSQDDIIYSFPPQEEKLTALRGLFLTLSSSAHDVVQSGATSSALELSGQPVNVVYHKMGRDVFIVAASANSLPLPVLQCAMEDVRRMLCTVFGAVDRAFRNGEHGQLDQVFGLLFHRLLCKSQPGRENSGSVESANSASIVPCSHSALDMMQSPPFLQLSEENRLICDEILSEFEAVDFDDFLEDSELYSRRSYMVLGCSLFYKKHLVCGHLRESDLRDIYSFLQCHSLLALAARQPIDELVVWQEVYLTRRSSPTAAGTNIGYQEPQARWFMLIVGMKHFLLATLLEAGGCSQEAVGRPGPHPLFVDQARATLVQLDTEEVHMSTCCQDRLSEDSESAAVVSAERYFGRSKPGKEENGPAGKSSGKPPSPGRSGNDGGYKYRSSPRTDRRPGEAESNDRSQPAVAADSGLMRRQGSKLSYGSNDSGGSGSSTGAPKSKSSRFSSLLDMSSIGRSMSALHIDTVGNTASQGKLTRGKDNVLFHFIHHNDLEGVLVTPGDLDLPTGVDGVHREVLANFHRCVLNIRSLFKAGDMQQAQDNSQKTFQCESSLTLSAEEHGVLFQCPVAAGVAAGDRRQQPPACYWVVGRRFTTDTTKQELYVCFHESASQSLVEMAFALGFGT